MALPMAVEQDVHDLRERMKYIEGWKDGEAERYGRLERDVAGIKTEIVTSRDAIQAGFRDLRASNDRRFDAMQTDIVDLRGSMDRRFETMDRRFETMDHRFEHLEKRFDRVLWLLMLTLSGVLTQIVATVAMR